MKSTKRAVFVFAYSLLFFSFLIFPVRSFAATPFDLYSALVDTLIGAHYRAGDEIASRIEAENPGHPAAILARAAVKAFQAADVTGGSENTDVLAVLDSAAKAAEVFKSRPAEDKASLSFVRGCALFGRGLILSRQGKVFSGMPQVIKARSEIGRCIEARPDFYDAYLGRGAFRYMKVVFLSKFDPFGLVTDAEDARRDVELSMNQGTFTRWLAVELRAWLGPSMNEHALADSLCALGLARFPESRAFLWPLAFSFMDQKRYADAEKVNLDLLHQYQKIPDDHGFEQLWLADWLVKCADAQGRPEDAEAYAQAGLAVPRTPFVTDQRKDQVKRLRERLKK